VFELSYCSPWSISLPPLHLLWLLCNMYILLSVRLFKWGIVEEELFYPRVPPPVWIVSYIGTIELGWEGLGAGFSLVNNLILRCDIRGMYILILFLRWYEGIRTVSKRPVSLFKTYHVTRLECPTLRGVTLNDWMNLKWLDTRDLISMITYCVVCLELLLGELCKIKFSLPRKQL